MNSARLWPLITVVLLVVLVLVSIFAFSQYQTARAAQARLDCARPWAERAMQLHDLHLRDPSTTTDESQRELMDYIMNTRACLTGETPPAMGY